MKEIKLVKKYTKEDIQTYESLPQKPLLFVRNLSKKYFGKKQYTINCLNFDVFPGEFHAFIGANGAGKTTTIKSLIGAYINWTGTILVGGYRNNSEDAKKMIGYIPENARFPEQFSSLQYLLWMTVLSGYDYKEAKEIAINKLKSLSLWNLRKASPNTFSSGQKKKILLAQALIHNPRLIIMDEPVANLDPTARREFFEELIKLTKQGIAIFISSHVLAELDLYSDAITILDGGKIVYTGKIKEILDKFKHNRYIIQTQENQKLEKYLSKHLANKYKYDPQNDYFIVRFSNKKELFDLQIFLNRTKNSILDLHEVKPSLDEIYEKMIIKGSTDTMKKDE